MSIQLKTKYKTWCDLFSLFALGNLLFFLLQIAWISKQHHDFALALHYPLFVYWEIIKAFSLQMGLYLLLSAIQASLLKANVEINETLGFYVLYGSTILVLLTIHTEYFPSSQFSQLKFLASPYAHIVCTLFLIGFVIMLVRALLTLKYAVISLILLMGLGSFYVWYLKYAPPVSFGFSSPHQPNLMIIGIDSLPPSAVTRQNMPHLHALLENSVHFQNVVSPLARTSPAWTTILTGLYPQHHKIHENLYPIDKKPFNTSIANRLKTMGYHTIFASDDRRFNHLGKEAGFKTITGPPIDIIEILLGTIYDFPLSNLLINTPLGPYLFPYHYANRASAFSYQPNTFDKLLQQTFETIPKEKPLFFAVHFTLPHWPYTWASTHTVSEASVFESNQHTKHYHEALKAVDNEVSSFVTYLKTTRWLKNAMLVVLSDHGETFYESGSRPLFKKHYQGNVENSPFILYLKKYTETALHKTAGHGSDLLSPNQFLTILGFQYFKEGKPILSPQSIKTPIGLIDIAPTIATFLKFQLVPVDGISLAQSLQNKTPLPERQFMLESGMLPNRFLSRALIVKYARLFFEINPQNSIVQMKKTALELLFNMKLYGILEKEWLLALYPNNTCYIPVLLNRKTGQWIDYLGHPLWEHSPGKKMLEDVQTFYKSMTFC